ncbi:MAG TPA: 30S ribosomal protein S6 [Clostridiaceae bacterium]|jgi:small subunit ribosomal protein S6|nr:30S ribosomal protein S6 [Clostridiaceae bacterium]
MARDYEALYIINPQLEEEEIKSIVEKFSNLIKESAQLKLTDEWGKRKLAYLVEDFNEGYYVLTEFSADPDFPQELERVFKITDGIIKYLIIKKD